MPRSLILTLVLVAISNIPAAVARLGDHHAHGPALPTGRARQIRKAHHTRRYLADGTGKGIADKLGIVEALNLNFKETMNHIEMVSSRHEKERMQGE